MTTNSAFFNYESTTDEVLKGLDLHGKTMVITGASTGLGLETARSLASAGARIVIAARNLEKIEHAKQLIKDSVKNAELSHVLLELSDLNSVRSTANELLKQKLPIDVLINNAGVMACPFEKTAQGFEMQFGSNHLGHFLFTGLITPLLKTNDGLKTNEGLKANSGTRVVCLSSAAHKFAAPNLEDPNYLKRPYSKWQAYGEAKSANALFALALNERLKSKGIECFSVHPGMIATELGRHLAPEDLLMFSGGKKTKEGENKTEKTAQEKSDKPKRSPFKTIPQGAATSVWAATSAELTGKGGCYLEDCQIAELSTHPSRGYAEYIADKNLAEKLWQLSETLVGEKFKF